MNKICLYGASGHGKVIKEIIDNSSKEVKVFFDDLSINKLILNIPVLSSKKIKYFNKYKFVISIGDNKIRKKISKEIKVEFTSAFHQSAIISDSSKIKEGTVVMAGAVINAQAEIGKHCIINSNSVVEHDCKLADYVHISPNATVTGNIKIGEGTHVGAGATIIPNVSIGKWVTIGAGTVILKDIPDYAIVVGNPGKIIKNKK